MFNNSQKENFIRMIATNVGYFNKDLVIKHILQFLHQNQSFSPREAVRSNANDPQAIFSFIQLGGFVQIGSDLFQMLIGMPKNYPAAPPIFLISADRQYYNINEEQKLIQNRLIVFQKNQRGQEYIRLRFPVVERQWQPRSSSVNSTYKMLINTITHPVLIRSKQEQIPKNPIIKSSKNIPYHGEKNRGKPSVSNKQTNQIISALEDDYIGLLSAKQSLIKGSEKVDYEYCRGLFLEEKHLASLQSLMNNYDYKINAQIDIIDRDLQRVKQYKSMSPLLDLNKKSPQQLKNLHLISEGQALKEAEVIIRSKIQSDQSIKFSDYKKTMKALYDRMFDNQTQLLQNS